MTKEVNNCSPSFPLNVSTDESRAAWRPAATGVLLTN